MKLQLNLFVSNIGDRQSTHRENSPCHEVDDSLDEPNLAGAKKRVEKKSQVNGDVLMQPLNLQAFQALTTAGN